MITKQQIKIIKENFSGYIELLKDFEGIEKAELNDFCASEELLRDDIINTLNKLKEDYF